MYTSGQRPADRWHELGSGCGSERGAAREIFAFAPVALCPPGFERIVTRVGMVQFNAQESPTTSAMLDPSKPRGWRLARFFPRTYSSRERHAITSQLAGRKVIGDWLWLLGYSPVLRPAAVNAAISFLTPTPCQVGHAGFLSEPRDA